MRDHVTVGTKREQVTKDPAFTTSEIAHNIAGGGKSVLKPPLRVDVTPFTNPAQVPLRPIRKPRNAHQSVLFFPGYGRLSAVGQVGRGTFVGVL